MSLAGDWQELEQRLPDGWGTTRLRLTIPEEGDCARAAALLGPANPGRRGKVIRFYAARRGAGPSPNAIRSLLARIDAEGIRGELELVGADEVEAEPEISRPTLVASWDAAVAALPPDWSDLYAEVELVSSDWLERAALLMAPVNPARYGGTPGFRFRASLSQRSARSNRLRRVAGDDAALPPAGRRGGDPRRAQHPARALGHRARRDAGPGLVRRRALGVSDPVSWLLIEPGWEVVGADGQNVGTVDEVVGDPELDIFRGLNVATGLLAESRYVPAEDVGEITEGRVQLTVGL